MRRRKNYANGTWLQAFFREVQEMMKGLESKYPELKLVDNETCSKPLPRDNISYLHGIGEAQNGE